MSQFRRIDNRKEWQELLNKVLFKTFFHNLEWEDFLENNFKWLKFEHYLYGDEVLLSLARYKVFGKERLISHPFCEYGGPLPLKKDIDGRRFREGLYLNFKDFFRISFHPQIPAYFKNLALKEPDSSRDTYFIENINQKTEENIFSSFRKTLRHSINKAQTQNLEIKKCGDKEELKYFYNLYLKTTKRHKTIPYPFSFFQYFLDSQNSEIILAKSEDKIIAGSVFLFYDKFIHYFLNASDEIHRDKKANYLILWDQIKKHLRGSYQVFDFGGTGRGSALEVFKRGWGTRRYPIFELKNFSENKLKKSKLRNIFGLLPSFLIKKVGSYLLKYKL
ncbi:MAG: peptidoglycan bridge formation glycyltransferase FemA/FemB family protein [Patescibacteria group bacterium]|nr:peptidoglycan bridge formation glycyltransferase FemA/FemB family protein [Patescibacteria group bacterium]